jgi:hypothetical protein
MTLPPSFLSRSQSLSASRIVSGVGFCFHFAKLMKIVVCHLPALADLASRPRFVEIIYDGRLRSSPLEYLKSLTTGRDLRASFELALRED